MRPKFECTAEFIYWLGRNVAWILALALAALLVVLLGQEAISPATVNTTGEARWKALEQRVTKLEQATPPTCVQVYPDKFQIDIYPALNLGRHKIASPP